MDCHAVTIYPGMQDIEEWRQIKAHCLTTDEEWWNWDPAVRTKKQQNIRAKSRKFEVINSALYAKATKDQPRRKVISDDMVYHTTKHTREANGHSGRDKTYDAIISQFHGISRSEIEWYTANCPNCQHKARSTGRTALQPIRILLLMSASNLISLICEANHQDILTIKDNFTRYVTLWPLINKEAASVVTALSMWIQCFGPPSLIHTDNGTEFLGATLMVCQRMGIPIVNGAPCQRIDPRLETSYRSFYLGYSIG
jgi:transposase-like protein